ncbi:hypothetical protein J2741_002374 [Methanolinea mesophila]|uniref:SdrD B-like domain-containing protein n=1 Tax=Methanolinea mesophila TaxID=547055 RepID=UPI001AE88DA5|nr:SdrD B-like domain-containing protein [Methanolinea mesophila]MBP1929778.1 hypothetical protein [Methanolinea mesophila]
MRDGQVAVSEVVGTILIIVLVIAVAIIMASQFLGFFNLLGKSAYIAPEIKVVNVSGVQAISLYSRGGDVASVNASAQAAYRLGLYVDTPERSDMVKYDPSLTYFGPGDTLYIYRTPAGYYATGDLTGITGTLPLPGGPLSLRLVDETAHILIANEGIGGTGTGTGTVTGTTTATTTVTTTATTMVTTSPTPTQPSECGSVSGMKYNDLNGNGVRDPNEPGLSGWEIKCYNKPGGSWVLSQTTTTNGNGDFVFNGLKFSPAEQYRIVETQRNGWKPTNPSSGEYDNVILNPSHCYATGINFGNQVIA